jgi:hypothetical protein
MRRWLSDVACHLENAFIASKASMKLCILSVWASSCQPPLQGRNPARSQGQPSSLSEYVAEIPMHFQVDGVLPGSPGQEHTVAVIEGGVVADDDGWVAFWYPHILFGLTVYLGIGLCGTDLHDPLFELFVGDDGFVLDPGFVGVDGVDGIFEDAGDLLVLVDPHSDEGKDADVGVEQFIVF